MSLTNLSDDLLDAILRSIEDLQTLLSAISLSSRFYNIFKRRKQSIVNIVVYNSYDYFGAALPYAVRYARCVDFWNRNEEYMKFYDVHSDVTLENHDELLTSESYHDCFPFERQEKVQERFPELQTYRHYLEVCSNPNLWELDFADFPESLELPRLSQRLLKIIQPLVVVIERLEALYSYWFEVFLSVSHIMLNAAYPGTKTG
jgi:hypothetical protein